MNSIPEIFLPYAYLSISPVAILPSMPPTIPPIIFNPGIALIIPDINPPIHPPKNDPPAASLAYPPIKEETPADNNKPETTWAPGINIVTTPATIAMPETTFAQLSLNQLPTLLQKLLQLAPLGSTAITGLSPQ